jgi:hypothetical protein
MGLTKPRAYQIFDIDYKQSVRVVTVSNITLSGGAPSSVDGVNLSLNDRVLVTAQSTGSQNGLYYVTTVGSGSDGTWARSNDGNETGEIDSGMVVMVSEGNFYADTQWKLTTNDPITIGVTTLTFVQNYGVPYTAGTAPPTQNLVIGSQWYNTTTDVIYEYQYDGTSYYWVDISSPAFGTNNAQAGTNLANGNSNVSINDAGGNVTVGVGGTNNIAVFKSSGTDVNGNITVTYAPATATGVAITASSANTQGGTGYADFLRATNTSGGATNPSKTFRVNSTGGLEIIKNAYNATIFSLSDAGVLSVTGSISVAGKQAVNGPAFRAYIDTGQTILSNGTQQKVTFGTETFDTNANFASSRFTPTTEGYYQINSTVRIAGGSSTGEYMLVIWKNGSEYARGSNGSGTEIGASFYSLQVSDIAYANGSTDYFEIYIQQTSGSDKDTTAGAQISYFSGVMVRGA